MALGNPTTDVYALLANGLTKNMRLAYKEQPVQWPKVIHGNTTKRRVETSMSWIGRGVPVRRDPRQGLTLDGIRPNFSSAAVMIGYTQADCIAEEDILDDEYGVLVRWAASRGGEFATAWRTLEEMQVFNYLAVTAFATAPASGSPDGQPYASTAHPMSAADTSTTWSNVLDADLSPTSFHLAISMLENQLQANGVTYMYNEPAKLIINPYNYVMATRLVRNEWNVESPNRDINVYKGACEVVKSPYFKLAGTLGGAASPIQYNGWALQGQTHFFEFYWREQPLFRKWVDENIRSVMVASHARFAVVHEDPRGIVFSTGS